MPARCGQFLKDVTKWASDWPVKASVFTQLCFFFLFFFFFATSFELALTSVSLFFADFFFVPAFGAGFFVSKMLSHPSVNFLDAPVWTVYPVMILILLLAEIAPVKLNELVYFAESGTEISLAVRSFDVTTTFEPSGE